MTLKQEVHTLIDELPVDSIWLRELRETLLIDKGLDAAQEDIRQGKVYTSEEFLAKVAERWPRKDKHL